MAPTQRLFSGLALATLFFAGTAEVGLTAQIPVAKSSYTKVTLQLDKNKTVYRPGENVVVHYTTQDSFAMSGWIGVIPSDVKHGDESHNDRFDVSFKYLNKKAKGTLTFTAPTKKGNWDLRMHNTDSTGKEIAYVSFEVK